VPVSLNQRSTPDGEYAQVKIGQDLGIYGQDQWTINRLTLNLGLRFDYFEADSPAQTRPADVFLPESTYPALKDVPNWKDINPRIGAAYDLFGNGKTAIKAQIGRYDTIQTTDIVTPLSQSLGLVTVTSRTWNDSFFPAGDPRAGNFLPDC